MIGVLLLSLYAKKWEYCENTIILLVSLSLFLMLFALGCYFQLGLKLLREKKAAKAVKSKE